MSDEDGFLSRWSRRKRAVVEETAVEEADTFVEAEAPPEDESEEEALERLGLPDPDTLEKGDDFSVFMAAAVPEMIRRRALRRLWRSNPALAVLDGLNDYDGDFTGDFVKPGTLKTAYQVGRGFLKRAEEVVDKVEQVAETAREREVSEAYSEPEHSVLQGEAEAVPIADEADDETAGADEPRATRRRMSFSIESDDTRK